MAQPRNACQEQLKAIANLRSYVAASEDLVPEDTSPESLSKPMACFQPREAARSKSQGENSPGIAVGAVWPLDFGKRIWCSCQFWNVEMQIKISQGSAWKMHSW